MLMCTCSACRTMGTQRATSERTVPARISLRRYSHFAGIPSPSLLKHLLKEEGGCSRMTVSPTARHDGGDLLRRLHFVVGQERSSELSAADSLIASCCTALRLGPQLWFGVCVVVVVVVRGWRMEGRARSRQRKAGAGVVERWREGQGGGEGGREVHLDAVGLIRPALQWEQWERALR